MNNNKRRQFRVKQNHENIISNISNISNINNISKKPNSQTEPPSPPPTKPKAHTYLGPKGYTLLKSEMTVEEETWLKTTLTIKPFQGLNISGSSSTPPITFPVYRESSNKFYVPRYFGQTHWGNPQSSKIQEGDPIHLTFQGTLRENQLPVIEAWKSSSSGGLLDLPCAYGKTTIALYIISLVQRKTLVLVHKEFLLNQWVERIQQFLPHARIGRIQGKIIDVENKDIVLGMIQSVSMKEYPETLFGTFGFTIIDEVHHISSEVFSNCLFKIVTPYMLGLSATMERKDRTTFVFKMFLGQVLFKGTREHHALEVRAIHYRVDNDDEFNEVEYDYRGNPKYSTMISKLCAYNRRSDFLLKVITDMLIEHPTKQIMVLAQNKSLLHYLFSGLNHRGVSSVGYYVGGMKEAELQQSSEKKVILATFQMAAEGLDIKTLSSLVLATPKTSIEQSVGRILRVKHGQPIVVDLVDAHSLFQNQWQKRKQFFKKNEYRIVETGSHQYQPDVSLWKVVYRGLSVEDKVNQIEEDDTEKERNINDNNNPSPGCLI